MKPEETSPEAALLSRLASALSARPEVLAAYVHGSFGTPCYRKDSDVDCALLLYPGHTLSAVERMRLESELSATLAASLDLGLLVPDNLIYFIEAVHRGKRIFCRDQALADELVGRAFSFYARLKEDRKEVEAAYHAA